MHLLLLKLCYAVIFIKFKHISPQFCLFPLLLTVLVPNIGKFA